MTATPPTDPMPCCPRCACALPEGHHERMCPGCLMQLAMEPPPASTSTGAAPATPEPAVLQPLFPDYELQSLIGRGGMGAVYRARQLRLDRLVAIKVLLPDLAVDPDFAQRFEREARAMAKLDHPGIVRVHDFGRAGDFWFLVMDHVDGANLREVLAPGALTAREALQFVPQLCDALQYAHDHRLVHRDIKPENILVDQHGRVRITDFGLAKLLGQDIGGAGLTRTHQALGTPHYMAPEQVRANATVDHRADIYSLGVVIYEMLTGELPIGRFAPPSAVAKDAQAIDPVVMKSLESNPAQRYQQAREVRRDLDGARLTTATGPVPPAPPVPAPAPLRQAAAEPAAPAPLEVLLRQWTGSALVLVASFMDWLTYTDRDAMRSTMGLRNTITYSGNAWNVHLLGMPGWIFVVHAIAISTLTTLRANGRSIYAGVPFLCTMLGTLLCGYSLLALVDDPNASPGFGLVLTLIVFLAWNANELRRHMSAKAQARHSAPPTAPDRRRERRLRRRSRRTPTN